MTRERDAERVVLIELRRVEEDREEEVQWEKGERRRVEEQKKLVDLALAEYAALVKRLDPTAVPPSLPRRVTDNILQAPPVLSTADNDGPPLPPKELPERKSSKSARTDKDEEEADKVHVGEEDKEDTGVAHTDALPDANGDVLTSADAISNLLVGQRGVHRLFRDFTSALTTKDKEIHQLQTRAEDLNRDLGVVREQLEAETRVRVEVQNERDRVLRDDASAAKVVERYMTFSQKAHETVHAHLAQQRSRAAATQASLRAEAAALRRRNRLESERSTRLRAAAEEMSEELGRESAGRRREIALRLGYIAAEEERARRAESWLDRVRRAKERPDGARDVPDFGALVDEAVEILAPIEKKPEMAKSSFRPKFLRRKEVTIASPTSAASVEDESLARIYLAEELVQNLVTDYQVETERRVDLERQRVAWLAKEAEDGVPVGDDTPEDHKADDGGVMFDVDDEDGDEAKKTEVVDEVDKLPAIDTSAVPAASPPPPPELDELAALFQPLEARYIPLQKSLHDQSVSLKSLRTSLPEPPATSPIAPSGSRRAGALRALSLLPARSAYDDLISLLDSLHEVIEDARVDVEIAMADEDRQHHGFAALLGVGASGVVQASNVLRDATEYVVSRTGDETHETPFTRLDARVADIEHDLATIKRTLHEMEGMQEQDEGPTKAKKKRSPFATLSLRTVSSIPLTPRTPRTPRTPAAPTHLASALTADSDDEEGDAQSTNSGFSRPGILSSVSRSLSSGVVGAASGVAGAPRRMTDFAGGLYRPRQKSVSQSQSSRSREVSPVEDGDVE